MPAKPPKPPATTFERAYPAIARWADAYGWIEIGRDDFSRSLVRALDIGGLVWEGDTTYPSLDGTLQAREDALARVLREQFGEDMYAT